MDTDCGENDNRIFPKSHTAVRDNDASTKEIFLQEKEQLRERINSNRNGAHGGLKSVSHHKI